MQSKTEGDAEISLYTNYPFFKQYLYNFTKNETKLEELREYIRAETDFGIQNEIKFNGSVLSEVNDSCTLTELGISSGDKLNIRHTTGYNVFIKTLD